MDFLNVEKELEQMLHNTKVVFNWYRKRRTSGSAFVVGIAMYAFEKRLENIYFEEEISTPTYKKFKSKFNELKKEIRNTIQVKDHGLRDAMNVKVWTENQYICDEDENGYMRVFKK
ncbi:MAG: hypothetical protein AMQ22_00591 [Candidatus Methanofastidiosum methylothiophilum]|uniref:Uncharacterized protein n=1 Tax=Candidatus Methanofastidiosum methylothiophilum TaxID=1705564 RepID=A0A150J6G4_9EURY|nr:MAG: hypothetical protein AMQ22_00591 [Candidatus Methanofastidiosum methylthiophilus]